MPTKADYQVGEFYHVYTRGVDRCWLFRDDEDFERFYNSFFLFNDQAYQNPGGLSNDKLVKLCFAETTGYDARERLVDVVTFTLLNNQFHMLLVPLVEDGISKLMHKTLMGYSHYANKKYERRGALFETYQAKIITNQAYLEHIVLYAHLNVLDMSGTPWREGGVRDWDQALEKLEQHPWSGHHILMGREQKLPLIATDVLMGMYSGRQDYLDHLSGWSSRFLSNIHQEIRLLEEEKHLNS